MKKIYAVLVLVLFVAPHQSFAECLLTFNTYGPIYASNVHGRGVRLVEEINEKSKCDLIHFQEAWSANQIDIFDQGLKNTYHIYAPNRQSRIGLMNFSLRPWQEAKTYSYRANYDGHLLDDVRKLVHTKKAFAVLDEALAGTFSVNTHLHPTSERVRILQMIDLLNWRIQHISKPLVLTGDFNIDPNSFEHAFVMKILNLNDSMLVVNGSYPAGFCTYCASNSLGWLSENHTFDYVFFSRLAGDEVGWTPKDIHLALTGNGQPLSDHYGLKVDFAWGPGISSALDAEKSKAEMLQIFDAAISRIQAFEPAQQLGYVALMGQIRAQIKSGEGPYGKYFSQIFQKY